ncbi:MAG: DUF58 domain-containing protein [Zoogloeaceae bacterium]|jgi:uncharacterized protein (DUF58 family)|nr:DUF58 domain-containing protein [Zoogloeaceae bacterium]
MIQAWVGATCDRPMGERGSPLRSSVFRLQSSVQPTAAGIVWLAAVLALLATAINYGNNLIFALAFLLLSIWLQSAWMCWRNLSGLIWQPEVTPPAFAGETLHPGGNLRDPAGRRHEQIFLADGRQHQGTPIDLAADSARVDIALPALTRGRQQIGRLRLVSLHPLGLWRASRAVAPLAALVYPRPAGDLPLPAKAPRPAHRQQESGDFQGVRAYAPGDSPRRVNWRVYGRREELAVNNFDGGQGGHALWLDMDACAGDAETRLSQLCQWILAAGQQGLEYGLRLPNAPGAPPGQGRGHRQDCLEMLALHPGSEKTIRAGKGENQ